MTRSEFYRVFGDAFLDALSKARSGAELREQDLAARLVWDILHEREEEHEKDAELHSSKVYDAGRDLATPFYGRSGV
jgi:hypothetical protein